MYVYLNTRRRTKVVLFFINVARHSRANVEHNIISYNYEKFLSCRICDQCYNDRFFLSVGDQLTLITAFRQIVHLSGEWYTLGLLLNVPRSSLSTIRTNIQGDHDRPFKSRFSRDNTYDLECLHETLQEWLNQTDPPPTWWELAEAVKSFDPDKAQVILYKGVQHVCVCV